MSNAKLKNDIYDFIKSRHSGVTFTELARHVEGFGGDIGMKLSENLIISCNNNSDAAICLDDLMKERVIYAQVANPIAYLHDGDLPNLPIAWKVKQYKSPHFLPVTFGVVVTEPKTP